MEEAEQPDRAQQRDGDRRAVGADPILHDRRLLALDPGQQAAQVQDEEHHEGDPAERDAEIGDDAHTLTAPVSRRPPSPSIW